VPVFGGGPGVVDVARFADRIGPAATDDPREAEAAALLDPATRLAADGVLLQKSDG